MLYLIFLEELHSLKAPNSFVFQLQLEGGSNLLVSRLQLEGSSNSPNLWLQLEGGYNTKSSLTTTERWLQPPFLAPSNNPDVEVE